MDIQFEVNRIMFAKAMRYSLYRCVERGLIEYSNGVNYTSYRIYSNHPNDSSKELLYFLVTIKLLSSTKDHHKRSQI